MRGKFVVIQLSGNLEIEMSKCWAKASASVLDRRATTRARVDHRALHIDNRRLGIAPADDSKFTLPLAFYRSLSMTQSQWTVGSKFHDLNGIERGIRKGRNAYDGYVRGAGLQFGNVKDLCTADADFQRAYHLAKDRTIVDPYKLINFYMLIRFYLPTLNPGAIAEFGSYKGGSCIFMAYLAKRFLNGTKVFGFDTFQGMPPTDRTVDLHKSGDFSDVDLPELRNYSAQAGLDNLTFVQGTFEETLPRVKDQMGPLSLTHIDCDIYSGVEYSYNNSKQMLVPGGYVVLDDPLTASCLGAFEAVEDHIIRGDKLSAEQVFPHLVFRYPPPNPAG
jgi:hypothetical protein